MPELSEERRLIQESARDFTRNAFGRSPTSSIREGRDAPRVDRRDGRARLFRHPHSGGIWWPRTGCIRVCLVAEELARGWMSVASMVARGNIADRFAEIHDARAKGQSISLAWREESFSAPSRCRSQMPDRMWRTFLPGETRRRRMGDHRQQILVHLRRWGRFHPRLRTHGPDHRSESAPSRHFGIHAGEAARHNCRKALGPTDPEDRLLRLDHMGTRFRSVPRAGREHDRRGGQGLLSGDCWAGNGAGAHGGALHRPRAGGPGRLHRVCQGASAVRKGLSHRSRRFVSRSPPWRPRSKPRAR